MKDSQQKGDKCMLQVRILRDKGAPKKVEGGKQSILEKSEGSGL